MLKTTLVIVLVIISVLFLDLLVKKKQIEKFENNEDKSKLFKVLRPFVNLYDNIISENNIIDSPFGTSTQKNEYKPKTDEKTSDDKKQIVQNKFENLTPDQKIDNEYKNEISLDSLGYIENAEQNPVNSCFSKF